MEIHTNQYPLTVLSPYPYVTMIIWYVDPYRPCLTHSVMSSMSDLLRHELQILGASGWKYFRVRSLFIHSYTLKYSLQPLSIAIYSPITQRSTFVEVTMTRQSITGAQRPEKGYFSRPSVEVLLMTSNQRVLHRHL